MDYNYEVIMCIVNVGYSEAVMDAAREFGARGGTVVHARGTANTEAEKLFNISIQPEKELVMIIVPSTIKEDILHALYQKVGLQSAGQGIAFCLPVEDAVGLAGTKPIEAITKPAEPAKAEAPKQETTSADQPAAEAEQAPAEESEPAKPFAIAEAEIAMDKERLHAELDALRSKDK